LPQTPFRHFVGTFLKVGTVGGKETYCRFWLLALKSLLQTSLRGPPNFREVNSPCQIKCPPRLGIPYWGTASAHPILRGVPCEIPHMLLLRVSPRIALLSAFIVPTGRYSHRKLANGFPENSGCQPRHSDCLSSRLVFSRIFQPSD
jgi:hypothetical protein